MQYPVLSLRVLAPQYHQQECPHRVLHLYQERLADLEHQAHQEHQGRLWGQERRLYHPHLAVLVCPQVLEAQSAECLYLCIPQKKHQRLPTFPH